MSEGLDFRIGLDTDGAVVGASKLDKEIEKLEKTIRRLEAPEKIEKLEKQIAKLSAGPFQRMIQQGLDPLLHKIKEVAEFEFIREGTEKLLELPGELAHEIFELGEEMIRTAAKAERTESSFKLLFGDHAGAEALEDIDKIAKHTEFADDRIKSLTQGLGKVGFEGAGLKRARAAALDIAAFSANPEEGLGAAEGALERIKRTGRVDNRTLGGLGIGEKTFLAELGKRTGQDAKTLKKNLDAGKVDAEQSLEALYTVITKKTGKKLGGAGADIAEGLDATLTHLGNLPEQYFEKLAHSSGFSKFGEQLKTLLDELDPDSDKGKRIFSALEDAFDGIATIMKSIDIAGVVEAGTEALAQFERGLLVVLSMLPGERGSKASAELYNFDSRQNQRRLDAAKKEEWARRADENGTTGVFEKAATTAKEDFAETGKRAAEGYAGGLSDGERIQIESANLGEKSLEALRDNLEIHSPSRKFAQLGRYSGAGFADGIEDSGPGVDRAIDLAMMAPARGAAGGGGRGGGMVTIAPSITVHVNGGKGEHELAQAVATAVADILPSALQGAIDNMAVQAGAS